MKKNGKILSGIIAVVILCTASMGLFSCGDKEMSEKDSSSKTDNEESAKEAEDISFDFKDGVLTVSGHGDMPNYEREDFGKMTPWYSERENITSIVINDNITSIGNHAFSMCEFVESVEIPNSVKSIGNSAFFGCENLKSIKIPDNVKNIGTSAFGFCKNLEEVILSNKLEYISEGTFYSCENLKSLIIPKSVTWIGPYALSCTSLTEIEIPDNVSKIYERAFSGCYELKSVTLPNNIDSILYESFRYCKNLVSITLPKNVSSIGSSAFSYCENLEEITILNPDCRILDDDNVISNGYDENDKKMYFDGTIHGYKGSTAQAYAEKYGCNFEAIE